MAGARPNDLPDMYLGEIRALTFTFAAGAGANNLDDSTFACETGGVTFEDEAESGLEATCLATAATIGRHTIVCTGELTSGETIKLVVRVNVKDTDCETSASDYDD